MPMPNDNDEMNIVPDDDACPNCHEKNVDNLTIHDDCNTVTCTTCNTTYTLAA